MSHALSIGSAMPIVDPDPAGIGTYLVSAVLWPWASPFSSTSCSERRVRIVGRLTP